MAEPVKVSKKSEARGVDAIVGGHYAEEENSDAAPTAEAAEVCLTEEEVKAKKRAEIEAKLAALKLKQEKEQDQRTNFFGDHAGITCDGCGCAM